MKVYAYVTIIFYIWKARNNELEMLIQKMQTFINEKIVDIKRQNLAYSNCVYLIETEKNRYIYKQYTENNYTDKSMEIKIQKQIGTPVIINNNEKFRIEEYIDHTKASWKRDINLIAKELKRFHNLNIDCDFTHKDMLYKMLHNNKDLSNNSIIKRLVKKIKTLLVYNNLSICHNDLQIGNIIKIGEEVKFIDFEYSCKGNPFIDIANLFFETTCDYKNGFIFKKEIGFTLSQKKQFLKIYDKEIDVEKSLKIIQDCEFFCHFYWFLWSRHLYISKTGPSKQFDYKLYSNLRLNFLVQKKIITAKEYDEIINLV